MNTNTLNFLKIFSKEFQIFSYKTSQILSLCIATVIYIWMKQISPSGILRMKFKHNGPCFFVNKNRFIMLICSPEWGTFVLTHGAELYGCWYTRVDVTPDAAGCWTGPIVLRGTIGQLSIVSHSTAPTRWSRRVSNVGRWLEWRLKNKSTYHRFHTESIKTLFY